MAQFHIDYVNFDRPFCVDTHWSDAQAVINAKVIGSKKFFNLSLIVLSPFIPDLLQVQPISQLLIPGEIFEWCAACHLLETISNVS